MTRPTGVLWAGAVFDRGGYGNVSRNYVLSLRKAGVPVRVFNLGHVHDEVDPATAQLVRECESTDLGSHPIGVIHSLPSFIPQLKFSGVNGLVSSSIFETHSLPPRWVELSNAMDQVWVPSRFNEETYRYAGVSADKLRVIPIPIDCDYFRPGIPPQPIPGASGFVFLYVFSFGWRKGFDLLLRAYLSEFRSGEDVTLLMKVYQGNPRMPDLGSAIWASVAPEHRPDAPGNPRVLIQSDPIPQDQLRTLYASCDLYVSTDRANGWGMPCMEVMAMGKAAATVDWSGSTEFMNDANSFLIPPSKELEPVDSRLVEANPAVYSGQKWAKVDVADVRRTLRRAYEDRAALKVKAERAAADMRDRFSFERIGQRYREVLENFEIKAPSRGRASVRMTFKTQARRIAASVLRRVFPRLKT
jgi:glycosyltransferase involved in cell wall biosynthesis